MIIKIYTDGGSRGNPGPSGAGGVIIDTSGVIVGQISEYLGVQTNNYAEYQSLYLTLKLSLSLMLTSVEVFMDSKLVIEQMKGNWKVKSENIRESNLLCKSLLPHFDAITFTHIPRKLNGLADALANKAMDVGQV